MESYDVDFYHKENGDCPVDDFLESLDTKMRAKVLGAVALLEANGPQLREPYSKFIGDGIFEIRAKQSSNITRVLYFFLHWKAHCSDQTALSRKRKKRHQRKLPWPKNIVQTILNERRRYRE